MSRQFTVDLQNRNYTDRDRSYDRCQAQLMADAIASYTGPITVCRPTTSRFRNHSFKAALRRGPWKPN